MKSQASWAFVAVSVLIGVLCLTTDKWAVAHPCASASSCMQDENFQVIIQFNENLCEEDDECLYELYASDYQEAGEQLNQAWGPAEEFWDENIGEYPFSPYVVGMFCAEVAQEYCDWGQPLGEFIHYYSATYYFLWEACSHYFPPSECPL
jgi:hypothetical protein